MKESSPSAQVVVEEVVEENEHTDAPVMHEPEVESSTAESQTQQPEQAERAPEENIPQVEDLSVGDLADSLTSHAAPSNLEKSNRMPYLLGIVILMAIVGAGVGFFIVSRSDSESAKTSVQPAAVTQTTTPPPVPAFSRENITFEVLNGSGVKGAAKSAAAKLETLGYTVVRTGNADKAYDKGVVLLGADAKVHETLIMADMISEFAVSSDAGELEEGSPAARLILGKE